MIKSFEFINTSTGQNNTSPKNQHTSMYSLDIREWYLWNTSSVSIPLEYTIQGVW